MAKSLTHILATLCLCTLSFGASFDDVFAQLFGSNITWLPTTLALTMNNLAESSKGPKSAFKAGTTWNIELSSVPAVSEANNAAYSVWDYDLFDAPKSTIAAFQAKKKKVICYFSAGSWENWRPDAHSFPESAKGKKLGGWPGERWLDTRNQKVRDLMAARIKLAAQKGCDAVDPDNVDGYSNPTGFPLTKADSIDYIKFLAKTAHKEGMACGLKNGVDMVKELVSHVDFQVNEQCLQYNECNKLQPFIAHNKAVFHIEYTEKSPAPAAYRSNVCGGAGTAGFSTLIKHMNLNAWTTKCPS